MKHIKFIMTICILFSSLPAFVVFVFLWYDNDIDYAWNKFEELVGEAFK